MKRRLAVILCLALLLPVVIAIAQTMVAIGQWVVINPATDAPIALTNTVKTVKRVTLIGRNANRTANTGTVWVGWLTNNDSQPIEIPSGEPVSLPIDPGLKIDLSKLYLDVETANDGVLVLWE